MNNYLPQSCLGAPFFVYWTPYISVVRSCLIAHEAMPMEAGVLFCATREDFNRGALKKCQKPECLWAQRIGSESGISTAISLIRWKPKQDQNH
jgi:hypothetical protein